MYAMILWQRQAGRITLNFVRFRHHAPIAANHGGPYPLPVRRRNAVRSAAPLRREKTTQVGLLFSHKGEARKLHRYGRAGEGREIGGLAPFPLGRCRNSSQAEKWHCAAGGIRTRRMIGRGNQMNTGEILRALANRTRLQMMVWLKDPAKHFPGADHPLDMGIPAREFERCGLSQSTVSAHLSVLHQAGLVSATRIGQWAFYRRDEKAINEFLVRLGDEL